MRCGVANEFSLGALVSPFEWLVFHHVDYILGLPIQNYSIGGVFDVTVVEHRNLLKFKGGPGT